MQCALFGGLVIGVGISAKHLKQLEHSLSDEGIRTILDFNKKLQLSEMKANAEKVEVLIDKLNSSLNNLNGIPELISSVSRCVNKDEVDTLISTEASMFMQPALNDNSENGYSEIKNIIERTIGCLGNNRLKEFKEKIDGSVANEMEFYDAFKYKIKELFGEEDDQNIITKILGKIHEMKNIRNNLVGLLEKSKNLIEKAEGLSGSFEDFNVDTYIVKVYGENGSDYNFFSISLPEHHELDLKAFSKLPSFIPSKVEDFEEKVIIVNKNTQKLSKDYYDKYINGCEKNTFQVHVNTLTDKDANFITLHGDEYQRSIDKGYLTSFGAILNFPGMEDIEVIDYHCPA